MYCATMAGSPRRRPTKFGEEVASILRENLARRQITQRELSRRSDVSSTQLNQYLRGLKSPTIEEFADICDALTVRPEVVMGLANYNLQWRENNDVDDDAVVPLPETLEWNLKHRTK